MTKMLNKMLYILKNFMLPLLMITTIYIIIFMFQRLDKEIFGKNFLEFLSVIAPFLLLIILCIVNTFLNHETVKNSFFYNFTSFMVMLVITIFCYRALMDKNMLLWHKYGYKINFNYFSDQIAPMKVMLYVLSFSNIMLIIESYLKDKKEDFKKVNKKKNQNFVE